MDRRLANGVIWRSACCISLLALCAAGAMAEAPAQPESVDQFVAQKLASWQERLKLEGWNISTVMTRRDALKPKTLGGIRWDKTKKTATIALMHPDDYRMPFQEMLDDLEFTIVHELVHLELAALPRSEASRTSEEYAVNQLTEALLGLDRQR